MDQVLTVQVIQNRDWVMIVLQILSTLCTLYVAWLANRWFLRNQMKTDNRRLKAYLAQILVLPSGVGLYKAVVDGIVPDKGETEKDAIIHSLTGVFDTIDSCKLETVAILPDTVVGREFINTLLIIEGLLKNP